MKLIRIHRYLLTLIQSLIAIITLPFLISFCYLYDFSEKTINRTKFLSPSCLIFTLFISSLKTIFGIDPWSWPCLFSLFLIFSFMLSLYLLFYFLLIVISSVSGKIYELADFSDKYTLKIFIWNGFILLILMIN